MNIKRKQARRAVGSGAFPSWLTGFQGSEPMTTRNRYKTSSSSIPILMTSHRIDCVHIPCKASLLQRELKWNFQVNEETFSVKIKSWLKRCFEMTRYPQSIQSPKLLSIVSIIIYSSLWMRCRRVGILLISLATFWFCVFQQITKHY